jgi:hypothetical protein
MTPRACGVPGRRLSSSLSSRSRCIRRWDRTRFLGISTGPSGSSFRLTEKRFWPRSMPLPSIFALGHPGCRSRRARGRGRGWTTLFVRAVLSFGSALPSFGAFGAGSTEGKPRRSATRSVADAHRLGGRRDRRICWFDRPHWPRSRRCDPIRRRCVSARSPPHSPVRPGLASPSARWCLVSFAASAAGLIAARRASAPRALLFGECVRIAGGAQLTVDSVGYLVYETFDVNADTSAAPDSMRACSTRTLWNRDLFDRHDPESRPERLPHPDMRPALLGSFRDHRGGLRLGPLRFRRSPGVSSWRG